MAGAQLPQQAQQPPTAAQPPVVVEDLGPEWLDYDTIHDTTDDGLFQEEFESSQRRLAVPSRPRPRLSAPIVDGAGPLPPPDIDVLLPLPENELSEYEHIREDNIRQSREMWQQAFGVEYPNVE